MQIAPAGARHPTCRSNDRAVIVKGPNQMRYGRMVGRPVLHLLATVRILSVGRVYTRTRDRVA